MPRTNPYINDIPAISFSKNMIPLVVNSADTYTAGSNVNAIGYFEFTAAVADGDQVVINWTALGVTMTAVAGTPDGSGNQFPAGDGGSVYVESLVPSFQGNNFIDDKFVVSADTGGAHPRLIFTAREPGPEYTFTSELHAGSLTDGDDDTPLSNFAHHVKVFVENTDDVFVQVFKANVPLDEPLTGLTTMDIHEILHASLSSDVPVLGALFAECINSIASFFIKFAQYLGDIPSIQKIYTSSTRVVAKGGLGMQPALISSLMGDLCPDLSDATQNRFLRQGSKNKLLTQDQPEWLTWINLGSDAVTVDFEVTINNADDSVVVFTPVTALEIDAYKKFQFVAGFTQLNILGQLSADQLPVFYCCRLKLSGDDGTYVTNAYNFVIDYIPREWPGFFIYENSYGAMQTLATVGKGQLEYDRTKDDAQLSLNRRDAASIGDFVEVNILLQQKGTKNIGYDRSRPRDVIMERDLLASHSIYLWDDGTLIPIGLTTTNLKDAQDGQNVYANSIEYYYKYQDEVWTEKLPQADYDLSELIAEAGSPIPNTVPPVISDGDTITVEYGDVHLSVNGFGQQVYTAPSALAGKTGYRINSTQLGRYFKTSEISYDPAGSFTIILDGFGLLIIDEQLIIWPKILAPE